MGGWGGGEGQPVRRDPVGAGAEAGLGPGRQICLSFAAVLLTALAWWCACYLCFSLLWLGGMPATQLSFCHR